MMSGDGVLGGGGVSGEGGANGVGGLLLLLLPAAGIGKGLSRVDIKSANKFLGQGKGLLKADPSDGIR